MLTCCWYFTSILPILWEANNCGQQTMCVYNIQHQAANVCAQIYWMPLPVLYIPVQAMEMVLVYQSITIHKINTLTVVLVICANHKLMATAQNRLNREILMFLCALYALCSHLTACIQSGRLYNVQTMLILVARCQQIR